MMNSKLKKISTGLICALVGLAMGAVIFSTVPTASAYEQINTTFTTLEQQIDASMNFDGKYYVNGLPLGLSSNPYDYIENNSEYDVLVAMGDDALVAIETCLNAENQQYNSLELYVLAIALEDITKTSLKNYENYFWMDSDMFLAIWEQLNIDVVTKVPQIMSDNSLTQENKWIEIAKFGIIAVELLEQYMLSASTPTTMNSESSSIELARQMVNLLTTSSNDTVIGIATAEIASPN